MIKKLSILRIFYVRLLIPADVLFTGFQRGQFRAVFPVVSALPALLYL